MNNKADNINTINENSCDCFTTVENESDYKNSSQIVKHSEGCIICSADIIYEKQNTNKTCYLCSNVFSASSMCRNSHYVCDTCHSEGSLAYVKNLLTKTGITDMINLMNIVRSLPMFNIHGPEHHSATAGVIAAVYKNSGGKISNDDILTAIDRSSAIPGGVCAYWGSCGAVLGAGAAFSVIMDSSPLKPNQRQKIQKIITELSQVTSNLRAARCCQREVWLTLQKVSELSKIHLDIELSAKGKVECYQVEENSECIHQACSFYTG